MSQMISPMLQLFREGATSYRPDVKELAPETGNSRVSQDNVHKILAAGLRVRDILVKPNGVLIAFVGAEHYYAPGLRVGIRGAETMALAWIAAEAGYGPGKRLWNCYRCVPKDYTRLLPDLNHSSKVHIGPLDHGWQGTGEKSLAICDR